MKAILVIDIDEEAYEEISKSEVYQMCVDIGYDYTEYGYSFHRPKKVLSLKPLPQKMRTDEDDIEEDSYWQGWNDCLDAITGETE